MWDPSRCRSARPRGALAAAAAISTLASVVACGGADTDVAVSSPPATVIRVVPGTALPPPTAPDPKPPSEWGAWPADSAPSSTTSVAVTTEAPGTTLPQLPPPSPTLAAGDARVYVLGDSVLAGAKVEIPAAMKGWKATVDAVENRFITQGQAVLQSKVAALDRTRNDAYTKERDAALAENRPAPAAPAKATMVEAIGRVLVINLCTNYQAGGGFDRWIAQYMTALTTLDRVVWMTCAEWSEGQVEANAAIRGAPTRYPNVVLADWATLSGIPGHTYADKIHLDAKGRLAVGELLALAVGAAPGSPPTTATR